MHLINKFEISLRIKVRFRVKVKVEVKIPRSESPLPSAPGVRLPFSPS